MARIQILELPEGADDKRPPFVLVVDEFEPQRYIPAAGMEPQRNDPFEGVAEKIGARAVLVFEETVEIPSNDVSSRLGDQFHLGMTAWTDGVNEALAKIQSAVGIPKSYGPHSARPVKREVPDADV
ncbi:hypothetical protein [Streptomyces reniochalinae]|uniref:Uncharacterized protein n=1 Tax=Streptomyces reniochalinae TaxID=2250578 RepID=A0A367EVP9_9ACTN|nr:hypothetical protein [Streptomyces reniochalinae]RCG21759.1 hypothetical protein DQ392_08610 [Streptomyces reniochalinae]